MKLNKWLILSHLIVMLTPIIVGSMFFVIINNYNTKTNFSDYISAMSKFKAYETKLNNPGMYMGNSLKDSNLVLKGDEGFVEIELYNAVGQQLYSSSNSNFVNFIIKEQLYSDLCKIQTGAKAYTLKTPVFKDSVLVGFYKIAIARNDFVQGVNYRTIFLGALLVLVIIAVYTVVMLLLNRKLNKPIKLLVAGMNKFAQGKESIIDYKAKDEIGELITNFNCMKEDIYEKRKTIEEGQKSKEYMISAISHDLKTPLTVIRASAESITDEDNTQMIKNKAKIIQDKSDYMKNMIDDLMMYNLLTTDYRMNFVELEGSELWEMLFSGYDEPCENRKIQLIIDINVQGRYKADVRQITRVVDNLMANALKYTPSEGHIWMGGFSLDTELPSWLEQSLIYEIRQWKNNQGLVILIKNEGASIENKEIDNIFKPFYQGDDSRNKKCGNGVGLGLSIVQLVLEKHNGEVKVFSESESNTFVCWLPMEQGG